MHVQIGIEVLKLIFLFMAVRRSFLCITKAIKGHDVSSSSIIKMSIGIAGFIYLQWLIPL